LLLTHKNTEALRELRVAVSLNPDSAAAHHYLGLALSTSGDNRGAAEEHREALRLEPTADNHYYLAACLIDLADYDQALFELEAAARLDPSRSLYRARKDELLKLMKAEVR
jgi:tetratricopeptide (TPR) repeat protein